VTVRDAIAQFKELSGKLTGDNSPELRPEVRQLFTLLAQILDAQHHEIQSLHTAVARAEHHARRHTTLP